MPSRDAAPPCPPSRRRGSQRTGPGLLLALLSGLAAMAGACSTPPPPASRTAFSAGLRAAEGGDLELAIQQFTLAVESSRDRAFPAALLERGECALSLASRNVEAGDRTLLLDQAAADFSTVLDASGEPSVLDARALDGLGRVARIRGATEAAVEYFGQVLEIERTPEIAPLHLAALRHLGAIHLESSLEELDASAGLADPPLSAPTAASPRDRLRVPQEHFARGLEIDARDRECNLGKGICLLLRGQDSVAVPYLERSVAEDAAGEPSGPRGHFYLARALEESTGYQRRAIHHLGLALDLDTERTFAPLYTHLVRVLPVYFDDPSRPEYATLVRRLLEFRGEDSTYWRSVGELGTRLASSENPSLRELGNFGQAVASARVGDIENALDSARRLTEGSEFVRQVAEIFPVQTPPRPGYVYGRALTLFRAGRHTELSSMFDGLGDLESRIQESPYYRKALFIEGQNILHGWLARRTTGETLSADEKLERDRTLGAARDIFQLCLEGQEAPSAVTRLELATVQELLESFASAFTIYEELATEPASSQEAAQLRDAVFGRIRKLHEKRLLPDKDHVEAWKVLTTYPGTDSELKDYVEKRRRAIQVDLEHYCPSCGRKAAAGEEYCLECGRRLPAPNGGKEGDS